MRVPCRERLVVFVAWTVLGCGSHTLSAGEDGQCTGDTSSGTEVVDESSDEVSDESSSDSEDTGEPLPCELAPLEVFDIEGLVGEETVVQELEVLDSGEVVVAGYFGLARGDSSDGNFELVDAPALLSSSFLRLVRGPDRELWASAFDQLGHSPDAGDSWETWTLPRDALVHRIDSGGAGRIYLGGDAILGTFLLGESSWTAIPVLDGDSGNYFESNMILGLVWRNQRLLAVERFGRMAGSADGESWAAIDSPPLGEPELLDLRELGLLLLSSSGEVYHSDHGSSWTERGLADGWPEVASYATQLAYRASDGVLFAAGDDGLQVSCDLGASWQTLPLGTRSAVIYDVSVGADGSLWAAGFNEVFRVGP